MPFLESLQQRMIEQVFLVSRVFLDFLGPVSGPLSF